MCVFWCVFDILPLPVGVCAPVCVVRVCFACSHLVSLPLKLACQCSVCACLCVLVRVMNGSVFIARHVERHHQGGSEDSEARDHVP